MTGFHHPFLIGKNCYLRGLEETDLRENYFQWFNDQEITRFMRHGSFPNSEIKAKEFFLRISSSENDIVLAIICIEDSKHIGNLGLHNINWLYRTAELGIIIGEKEYHGKSLAKEAMRLLLNHAFYRLNLHRVYLITDSNNKCAINAFEKSGFIKEGLLRQDCFRNGRYVDSIFMGCLLEDYEKAEINYNAQ